MLILNLKAHHPTSEICMSAESLLLGGATPGAGRGQCHRDRPGRGLVEALPHGGPLTLRCRGCALGKRGCVSCSLFRPCSFSFSRVSARRGSINHTPQTPPAPAPAPAPFAPLPLMFHIPKVPQKRSYKY